MDFSQIPQMSGPQRPGLDQWLMQQMQSMGKAPPPAQGAQQPQQFSQNMGMGQSLANMFSQQPPMQPAQGAQQPSQQQNMGMGQTLFGAGQNMLGFGQPPAQPAGQNDPMNIMSQQQMAPMQPGDPDKAFGASPAQGGKQGGGMGSSMFKMLFM